MTEEELEILGYKKTLCRVGYYLYINESKPFFCSLKEDGTAEFRMVSFDTVPYKEVRTVEEYYEMYLDYIQSRIDGAEKLLDLYKGYAKECKDKLENIQRETKNL